MKSAHALFWAVPIRLFSLAFILFVAMPLVRGDDQDNEYPIVDNEGFPSGFVLLGEDAQQSGWLRSECIVIDKINNSASKLADGTVIIRGIHYNKTDLERLGVSIRFSSSPVDPLKTGATATKLDKKTLRLAIKALGGVQGEAMLQYMDTTQFRNGVPWGTFSLYTPSAFNIFGSAASVDKDPHADNLITITVQDTANPWTIAGEIVEQFFQKDIYDNGVLVSVESRNAMINAYANALRPGTEEQNLAMTLNQAAADPTKTDDIRKIVDEICQKQRTAVAHNVASLFSIVSTANAGSAIVVNFVLWDEGLIDPVEAIINAIPVPVQGLLLKVVTRGGSRVLNLTGKVCVAFARTAKAGIKDLAENSARFIAELENAEGVRTIARLSNDALEFVGIVCRDINCFRGDDPVLTPKGLRPISEIRVGDIVTSYDVENEKHVDGIVSDVIVNQASEFLSFNYELADGHSGEVHPTGIHPFAVRSEDRSQIKWIPAQYLLPADHLIPFDTTQDASLRSSRGIAGGICYTLIVKDFHDYYVGEFPILVHNGPCFTKQWLAFLAKGNRGIFNFIRTYSDKWEVFVNMAGRFLPDGTLEMNTALYTKFKKLALKQGGYHEAVPRETFAWIIQNFRTQAEAPFALKCLRAIDETRISVDAVRFNNKASRHWPTPELAAKNLGFAPADNAIGKIALGHATGSTSVSTEFSGAYHRLIEDAFQDAAILERGVLKFDLTNYKKTIALINREFFRDSDKAKRLQLITDLYNDEIFPQLAEIFGTSVK